MKWIVLLLCVYVIYYFVLVVFDLLKKGAQVLDDEDTQIISVKDMLSAKNFSAKKMELSEEVRKEYLGNGKNDAEPYRPPRITGAIYAQGFEVNNYNAKLMRSGRAVFDDFAGLGK